jgi:hypothetical protein
MFFSFLLLELMEAMRSPTTNLLTLPIPFSLSIFITAVKDMTVESYLREL